VSVAGIESTNAGSERAAPASGRWWSWLVAIGALGAVLRAIGLDAGLWYDEIATLVQYVRRPVAAIVTIYDSQNQHLLYSVLARLSTVAFGESAAALRLPAAVFGVVSVGLAAWCAARIVARREALLVAVLLAVSYHHIWFSQNARGYTMLLCGALAGTGLLLDLLRAAPDRRSVGRVLLYGAAMGLAVYTHVSAVFIVAGHALVWGALTLRGRLAGRARWQPLAAFAIAGVLAFVLYLPALEPMLRTLARPTMGGTAVAWKQPWWLAAELARGLVAGMPGGAVALAAGAVVLGAGLVSLWRRDAVALALMLVPPLVTAVALAATRHNLWPRLFFFAAAFAVLIAVRGGFALLERFVPARAARAGVAGGMVVAALSVIMVPRAWGPKQDFPAARAHVERVAAPEDAVVAVDLATFPFERWLRAEWLYVSRDTTLALIEARHPRTWVVYTFPTRLRAVAPELWARLQRGYREVARFPGTVGGGAIVVMVNR
jgi:4-amino-4-deoxy-L-arabinose transferase-like glycosyltransferase